mmetsp:Transcript_20572/g.44538  ORF Transcript_20572/g.44538 Transcript_20572/m.44538 type:complete len:254 (-) Transcript_20572:473-1234(-)
MSEATDAATSNAITSTTETSPPLLEFLTISDDASSLVTHRPGGIYVGPSHWIEYPDTFPSVAAVINESSHETGCSVAPEAMASLDAAWHEQAETQFAKAGALDEWQAYLQSGAISNGRKLKLQIMVLPKHLYFKIHAHPNIEFEFTLYGALHEFRWTTLRATIDPADNAKQPLTGPEIAAHSVFEHRHVAKGETMVNQIGSVHQSFTAADEGCAILVLWSGCHANTPPSMVHNVSPELRPTAGWDNDPDKKES